MKTAVAAAFPVVFAVAGALFSCATAPALDDTSLSDTASADGGASPARLQDGGAACVATDAGCMTSSPGACAAGTMACDDAGAAVCVPIATSQACYSGPAATRGKGICKDGVQSCVGTLGACTGEVLPAPRENCFNALDDDCDGVVNNGCPDHLTLGAPAGLGIHGGTGGSAKTAFCPPNAFVTRSTFYFDHRTSHASGVAIYCAAPQLVQGASTYSVSLTPVTPAPYAVATGNNPPSPDGDYDCGITGLVAGTWLVGQSDSFVEGLGMYCSTGVATFAADNTLTFAFTEFGQGNYTTYTGGTAFRDDCPPGRVLVGYNLREGDYLDQIQAVCAPLVTVYK